MSTPKPGTRVTATVQSGKSAESRITGTVIAGRYPHMYLTLDVGHDVLRIPLGRVIAVVPS